MATNKKGISYNIKMTVLMFAATVLAIAPMAQLSAAENDCKNKAICLTGRILDNSQPNDATNYKYNENKPKEVAPGELFKIQFTVKNNSGTALKNVNMSWSPSRLTFTPKKGEATTATANNYKLAFNSFGKGKSHKYVVQAKFKDGVKAGSKIDSMPLVTAQQNGNKKQDRVNGFGIVVVDKKNQDQGSIHIKGSILDNEQNPRTNNYRYNDNNPKKVSAGKWFQIQFRIKNNTDKQLKNVKLNWTPNAIEFMPINNGKRGEHGRSVTAKNISIQFPTFNKGAERIYTQFVKFKPGTPVGTTINESNKGNMPKVTAQFPDGKQTQNPVLTLNAVVKAAPAGMPLEVVKTTDNQSPSLNKPFNYLISVKNTSNTPQTVKLTDVNMASSVQNFTSVSIEGATSSTLKIVNGEEAVQAAQEVADRLAAEEAAVQVTNDITAKYKALKAAQKKINQLRVASKKAKIAFMQAKDGQKQALKQAWDKAKKAVEAEKPKVKAAWDAYQAAKKAVGQPVAESDEPSAEDMDETIKEEDDDIVQVLTGDFVIAAGATANIKLAAVIVEDSEAANAIANEAMVMIGNQHEVSDETIIALCRTPECGGDSAIINPPAPEAPPASQPGGGGPAQIASTGPAAVAASVVGISALGYGARQWMASRRAMHDAMEGLYKTDHHDKI